MLQTHVHIKHSDIHYVVGVVAGTILPHLASRDRRLMSHKSDVDENAEISRIRATVRQWRVEAAQKGKPLQLPVMPFLLRNIWTGALILFSLLTFSTFFISTVVQVSSSNIDADNTFIIMQGHGIYRSCWYVLGSGDVGAFCDHHGGIGPCLSIHPNLTTVRSC